MIQAPARGQGSLWLALAHTGWHWLLNLPPVKKASQRALELAGLHDSCAMSNAKVQRSVATGHHWTLSRTGNTGATVTAPGRVRTTGGTRDVFTWRNKIVVQVETLLRCRPQTPHRRLLRLCSVTTTVSRVPPSPISHSAPVARGRREDCSPHHERGGVSGTASLAGAICGGPLWRANREPGFHSDANA